MSSNKAKVFAFYSYKGGTGRTTASANVSALLATKGHKVLCLDLDLDGPGISIVFSLQENDPFPLQEYFEKGRKINKTDFIHYKKIVTPRNSGLWILPASNRMAGTVDTTHGGRLLGQVRKLIDLAETELGVDVVIIDTPSGFGDLSALSMYVSTCVVALFRYSRQHLFGTARVADFVKKNQLTFLPAASCVPPRDFDGEKAKYKKMLETFYTGPLIEIKEDNTLKWRERVLIGTDDQESPALSGYDQLAAQLMKLL
jgi:MinD-like ATPase involved in chromosome partitioning or flagellar assembly